MTQQAPPEKKPPVAENLSKAINETVERLPDDQVRSVRLFGDYYRCNWWVEDKTPQCAWSTGKIRKSSFLKVTRAPAGLVIVDMGEKR